MSRPLTLADFAAVERDGREQFYPEMVRRGEIGVDEANHDWLCWKAIASWVEEPSIAKRWPSAWDLSWADLVAACERALEKRDKALVECKPENRLPLEDRRHAVAAILGQLRRTEEFYRTLNAQLQAEAEERREAARRAA
jgi:hypothetical protein